jgi:putative addiction module component (TIGR02574 family)
MSRYNPIMPTKNNVIADAMRPSDAERLEVAEALYESLAGPADADADQAWSVEIDRRLKEIDSCRATMVPWPEARRQIAEPAG